MDQNLSTDAQKLAGIVAQVRADVPGAEAGEFERVLRQRLDQAGVTTTDEEIAAAVAESR